MCAYPISATLAFLTMFVYLAANRAVAICVALPIVATPRRALIVSRASSGLRFHAHQAILGMHAFATHATVALLPFGGAVLL